MRTSVAFGLMIMSALTVVPATEASASTISVGRTGNTFNIDFTRNSSHSWNNGTLYISDTAGDSHAVHTNIWDTTGANYEGRRDNNDGNGTTKSFGGLYFNSSNYNLQSLHLQGCVNKTLGDDCSNGGNVINPYA